MSFRRDAVLERDRLAAKLAEVRKKIAALPEGELVCRVNGSGFKWYRMTERDIGPVITGKSAKKGRDASGTRRTERVYSYIPHDQLQLASRLALKKYYLCREKDLMTEIAALDRYLQKVDRCGYTRELLARRGMSQLILPQIQGDAYVENWLKQDYPRNPDRPESLKIPTIGGFMVRSKSEALIADMLTERKIPYRYECQMCFGRDVIYPDFTILNPVTHELILWEHFGMLGVQSYQAEFATKMSRYMVNGFLPGRNMIATFETKDTPFDVAEADRTLKIMLGEYLDSLDEW